MKHQIKKIGTPSVLSSLAHTAIAVAAIGLCPATQAAPIYNPGNGHSYEIFAAPSIDWNVAKGLATAAGGYLATLTSATENDWVYNNVVSPAFGTGNGGNDGVQAWLGGYQPAGSDEPDGNWNWITGETWSYANWAPGEPNNNGGGEAHLTINRFGTQQWNDEGSWPAGIRGYVVEYNPSVKSAVPDGGASAIMLGLGFLGAVGLRKKL